MQLIISENQLLTTKPPASKAINAEVEVVLKVHKSLHRRLTTASSLESWNPELRLLRILQDKVEDEERDLESRPEPVFSGKEYAASSSVRGLSRQFGRKHLSVNAPTRS